MKTLGDYAAWKAKQQQAGVGAVNVVLGSVDDAPDQVAENLRLGTEFTKATGKPTPPGSMVKQYKPVFQRAVENAKASTILSSSPMLTEWLRQPENAAVARDDLENLGWFETTVGATSNAVQRGAMRLPQGFNQLMAEGAAQRAGDVNKSFGDIYAEERASVGPEGMIIDAIIGPVTDLYTAGSRVVTSKLAEVFGGDQQKAAAYYQQQAGQIADAIAAIPMSPGAAGRRDALAAIEPSGDLGTDLGKFLQVIKDDPAGFAAFLGEVSVESAPALVTAAAAGVVTRNPAAFPTVLGATSAASERYLTPVEFFTEKGIDVSTPEGALAAISNPDLMKEAADRGAIRGFIIGALDTISGGLASETLMKSPIGNVLVQSIIQAVLGGGGEAGAQIASGQKFNINDVLIEGMAEFVTAPLDILGAGSASFMERQAKAKDAETRKVFFEELSGQSQNSKLRERLPERFQQFLDKATKDGPVENLFIPAQAWATYFQSQGVDPYEMAASIPGVTSEDLETAIQTGGDLKIPTASYATVMAGSPHDPFIMENARLSPDQMTSEQAVAFEENKVELLQEAWEMAEAARRDEEQYRSVSQQVYDTVVSRLRTSGRSTDVATTEAEVYRSFYETMPQRAGMTPEDFINRIMPPQVRGAAPAGMQLRDADALTRTLTEARNRKAVGLDRSQTLLEFISERGGIADPGGELLARDAAVIKRGKGKKTLRLERRGIAAAVGDLMGGRSGSSGFGFDDVARAAIEAGFMADDPMVLAYQEAQRNGTEVPDISRALLDAIDRELRGEPVVAAAPVDGLDTIEEYLAGLGVSLDDDDATIKAAMAEGERQYGQAALSTETEAFKRWFGDSKVVDAEGKPLVVYHGGVEGIEQFESSSWRWRDYLVHEARANVVNANFFTADRAVADTYRQKVERQNVREGDRAGAMYEVYLKIENPLQVDWKGKKFTVGDPTALIEKARAGGHDGIIVTNVVDDYHQKGKAATIYVTLAAEQIKSVNNRGTFDPADPRLLFQDMQSPGGGSTRGSISFQNGEAVISLFQSADLSTFLHETGHFFLTSMQTLAADGGPIAVDYQIVKDWWRSNADDVAKDGARVAGVAVTADDVRLALDNGTTGNPSLDNAIDIGMQEQFARATEQYFMEGKAPSLALRGAFEKFRAWLLSIYRKARGLNVNVSDEMRKVFDRMLATDAEIAKAQQETSPDVALTADDLGMTPEQFSAFAGLRQQAKDEAAAKLLAETMAPIRRAATEAYKAERRQVREITAKRLQAMPMFKAVQELRFGRDFDGNDTPTVKLDRAAIERDYGAGWLPQLPGSTKDGKGHKNAVFAHEGGMHPDLVAGMYGYRTGGELLDALAKAPAIDEAIEAETERVMRERHSDPLTDGSVQQLALDAVHGDKKGEALAAELKALNAVAGLDRGLTVKEARETARRTLRGMRVRDAVRADRFLTAERNAGQEAMRLTATVTREGMWMDRARSLVAKQARGAVRAEDATAAARVDSGAANASTQRFNEDAARMVEAKRRQLMNHMLYAEARKVSDATDKVVDKMARLNKPDAKLGKTRNVDFVKAARAVAARFGLAAGDKAFDFGMWLEQLRFDDPVTAADLQYSIDVNSQEARHFKELTVAEFETTADAIENILEVGKRSRELEIDGKRLERDLAISELIDQAEPRMKGRAGTNRAPTKGEKRKIDALSIASSLVRVEAWARDMDDGKAGVFTQYLVKPVMDALGVYREDRTKRLDQLLAIIEPRRGELLGKAVAAPELDYVFENKGELLHAILHTGNESNLEKLLLGRGWSTGLVGQQQKVSKGGKLSVDRQGNPLMTRGKVDTSKWDAMVNRLVADGTLTKADFDTAQAIWDLMDEIKRPAQSAHRRMFGFYFKEVEAAPVVTPFGSYRGGYVPAIIDQYAAVDAGKQDAAAAMDSQMDASMFPTTGSGFTKSRVQNYRQPLALNLMMLPAHMDKVLRFTHLEPVIRQTASLIGNSQVRTVLGEVNPDAVDGILTPWLVRVAKQAVEAPSTSKAGRKFAGVMRSLRKRVGLHTMALNIVNAAQQVTGIASAAVLVKPGRLKSAMARFALNAGPMRAEAAEASAMMRDRLENSSRVTSTRIEEIIVAPTVPGEISKFVDKHGYVLQQAAQNIVDVVVWHAAHDQAVAGGMDAEAAVFEADSVVRRSQGSFNPEDISTFEAGTAFTRAFTMFYSYFNTQLNLVGGEVATTLRTLGWNAAPKLFPLYFFGVLLPAVVAEGIVQAARGELGDEEDDGWLDDLLELFVGSQVRYVAGAVPILGPLTIAAVNQFNDLPYDDRLSTSPVVSTAERFVRAPASVVDAVTGNGSASRAVTDSLTTLGLMFGIPTGQLAKSAGYAASVAEGRSEPENLGDVVNGLLSGRDGSE